MNIKCAICRKKCRKNSFGFYCKNCEAYTDESELIATSKQLQEDMADPSKWSRIFAE